MGEIRLQKFLAEAGLASRRAAEEMIREGRVEVNGRPAILGSRVDPLKDWVRVDGRTVSVSPRDKKVYIALFKPRECITSARDPQGRKTVFDYLPKMRARVFPVGRLDYDAEGLLLLTNDGELANYLLHPRYGMSKVYEVKVKGHPDTNSLDRLRNGVELEEGTTGPAAIDSIRQLPNAEWLRIVLHQGWNRQIKRMCEAVGHPVLKIKRIAYGPVRLGNLKPGDHRLLSSEEVRRMYQMAGLDKE
ncbi:MAG: pseudouridine synthase [Syntrophobacteraceae bacterium]